MTPNLTLSAPQDIFLNKLKTKFIAYVGGFGSGKSFILTSRYVKFALNHPRINQAHYAPSYRSIRDVFFPTVSVVADIFGLTVKIRKTDAEVDLYRGQIYYGTIICRSMDRPENIVGYEVANDGVDELDTLKIEKAREFWIKSRARNRLVAPGVENTTGVATTPEGFRFVYSMFADNPGALYSMVQASTYENAKHLPNDYIKTLKEVYPEELVDAYIMGQFVNLTSGTVYTNFDRKLNNCTTEIKPGELLHIGMDFNVGNMNAIVFVVRDGNPHAVREHGQILDTPAMISVLKNTYQNHQIVVYPDSSGDNRSSNNASQTDISQLGLAGFNCRFNPANPRIKDRVAAKNAMFCNSEGLKRFFINTLACPGYTKDLEQQAYNKNGEPDKTGGNDHRVDAGGYFIAYMYPIVRPVTRIGVRAYY